MGLNGILTLNTYTGEIPSDPSSLGSTYWKKYSPTNEISIVRASNPAHGANGVKIIFEGVQEGKPIIITSGNLSGCTTVAARREGYIYKVYTDTTKSLAGFTSTTGVRKAVEVLELLTKEPISRVEGIMSNDFLVDYLLENFGDSLITYSSSEKKPDGQTTVVRDNASVFPYFFGNTPEHGFGTSMAALMKVNGNVVVRSLSESYSPNADVFEISVSRVFSKKF